MVEGMVSDREPSTTLVETTGDRPRRSSTGFDEAAVVAGAGGGARGRTGGGCGGCARRSK